VDDMGEVAEISKKSYSAVLKPFEEIAHSAKGLFKGPEVPDPVTPDAPVEAGKEGIRAGEMMRQSKRRTVGQLYMTRGQTRASTQPLSESGQTLG
jgi:hypothetical protein